MNRVIKVNTEGELENIGEQLIRRGICENDRNTILNKINYEYCEFPLEDMEWNELTDKLKKRQKELGLKCPYKLVYNSKEDGVQSIITQSIETLGWKFRVNDRGGLLEGNRGDGWEYKDPSIWKAHIMKACENGITHSLDIKVKKNNKGNFEQLKVDTPVFKFGDNKLTTNIKCMMDENTYDPFKDYLESDAVQSIYKELKEKHWHDGELDDSSFTHWEAVKEIIQFKKPASERNMYFETPDELNKWLLYSLMFPAVYATYYPGEKFAENVMLIGGEGSFKTSLASALLPKKMRTEHCEKVTFKMNTDDLYRTIRKSVYVIFDEMVGFYKDEEETKTILGSLRDNYVDKWHTTSLGYPRRCVCILTTNKPQPLKMSLDKHRRYIPFGIFPNEELTKIAYESDKMTSSGFMDYLYEWSDKHLNRLYAEMLLYLEEGRTPGLPMRIDMIRKKAIDLASGLDGFENDVREILIEFASERDAVDFEDIFEQSPYEKNRDREKIVKDIHRELGGTGELKRGKYAKFDKGGNEFFKKGTHFDLRGLKVDVASEVDEVTEAHKSPQTDDDDEDTKYFT